MEQILKNELILPKSGYEITSKEEMSYEDGKGLISVSVYFSFNTFAISSIAGFIGGAIAGFLSVMLARALPTWVGKVIGASLGTLLGVAIGSKIANGGPRISVPIFAAWIPFVPHYNQDINITDFVTDLISYLSGSIGGGIGGGFAGVALGYSLGARKALVGA